MALDIAVIILLGLASEYLLRQVRVPGLVGMLVVGMLLGPYAIGMLDTRLMAVSADFRLVALIVILLRAGLEIRKSTLHRVGKTAVLMSIVPSAAEALAISFAAPALLGIPRTEAVLLGLVLAAVSPAVVVPEMLKLIDRKRGTERGVPTMLLAAASADNVFVISAFSAVLGAGIVSDSAMLKALAKVPLSVGLGIAGGALCGFALYHLFARFTPRATKKTLIMTGAGVLLVWVESRLRPVPFSALIGVMAMGFVMLEKTEQSAHQISQKLAKVWVMAEILLFVLVGAEFDPSKALEAGFAGLCVIGIGLGARSIGTWLATAGSGFTTRERLFCVAAWLPKATVQAAIASAPLAAGVASGGLILAVAVLAILITAPLGAFAIEAAAKRLLD